MTDKHYNIDDVAQWLLSHEPISPKRLQKLFFYIQSWALVLLDKPFVYGSENNALEFEAWVHGPVNAELYHKYSLFKWTPIDKMENNDDVFDSTSLDLLESVWLTYGDYSANELENISHSEAPWINARKRAHVLQDERSNEIITFDEMKKYYKSIYIGDDL